mmetsp:Transcript_28976/g.93421  ORF Transcript_28976/g.93421 Transcript_28976/m.93421 type:complete len:257 (-) Transcript_28976:37-807(-)
MGRHLDVDEEAVHEKVERRRSGPIRRRRRVRDGGNANVVKGVSPLLKGRWRHSDHAVGGGGCFCRRRVEGDGDVGANDARISRIHHVRNRQPRRPGTAREQHLRVVRHILRRVPGDVPLAVWLRRRHAHHLVVVDKQRPEPVVLHASVDRPVKLDHSHHRLQRHASAGTRIDLPRHDFPVIVQDCIYNQIKPAPLVRRMFLNPFNGLRILAPGEGIRLVEHVPRQPGRRRRRNHEQPGEKNESHLLREAGRRCSTP